MAARARIVRGQGLGHFAMLGIVEAVSVSIAVGEVGARRRGLDIRDSGLHRRRPHEARQLAQDRIGESGTARLDEGLAGGRRQVRDGIAIEIDHITQSGVRTGR